jgi:hypothetical protein
MKAIFTFLLMLSINIAVAQTTRYFQFTTNCGHGAWQDTSFIAATSDPKVIDSMLANIARPMNERKFISGKIARGNAGYNHNASHWFLWHFILNEWTLTEMAVEVCDGCPYSDVDADTAYWIDTIIYYCPWSGKPAREIANPLGIEEGFTNSFRLFPNPASDELNIYWEGNNSLSVNIYDCIGQQIQTNKLSPNNNKISLSTLPPGIYFFQLKEENKTGMKKVVIE